MSYLLGMLGSDVSRRGTSPVLIGRATHLAALAEALETVRQGSPAALLIGGEAGVGKSRLIAEFAASARESGARVLTGECLELGADGLPFGPFTAMLRDLVRELGASEVTGLLPGGNRATRELARLLPELSGTGRLGRGGRRLGDGTRPVPNRDRAGWRGTGSTRRFWGTERIRCGGQRRRPGGARGRGVPAAARRPARGGHRRPPAQ
jgi:hypothetical protein